MSTEILLSIPTMPGLPQFRVDPREKVHPILPASMKSICLLFFLSFAVVRVGYGQSTSKTMAKTAQLKQEIALACQLTDKDQIRRMNELHQSLFKKVSRVIDHPNAVELVFAQPDSLISNELGEFIRFERLCCPWLLFQLTYSANHGPVSLKMGNSPKTKQMVELVMELDKIRPKQ